MNPQDTQIPATYKLMVDLSSNWSVEMRFRHIFGAKDVHRYSVETNLPFDIEFVWERDGEFYFYDKMRCDTVSL